MQNDPVKEAEEICEQITPPEQEPKITPKRVKIGDVLAFPNVTPDKAQVLKVLEEADVIQACVNLISAYGITDFEVAMTNCEERNRARGRYEQI